MRKLKIRIFTISFVVTLFALQFSVLNFNVDGLQINPVNTIHVTAVADAYEDDDSFGTAKDIALNTIQDRTIFPIADHDYAKFELDTFYEVTIETTGTSGDTRLWLYDEDEFLLAFDDDSGTNLFSKIEISSDPNPEPDYLNPGLYYIKVDDFANDEEIENYSLSLSASIITDPFGYDCAGAAPINLNSSYVRSLDPSDDIDVFSFTTTTIYNITLETSGGPSGDTVMGICTDCGDYLNTRLAEDDESGSGSYSRITLYNLAPMTYYVKVWFYNFMNPLLNYTLTITAFNSTVVDTTGPSISSLARYPAQAVSSSSTAIGASVVDMYGVVEANMIYSINYGSWIKTRMYRTYYGYYSAVIGPLDIGDEVRYFLNATDNSVNHNLATYDNGGSYYTFTVISNDAQDLFEKDNAITYAREFTLNTTQARRINPIGDIDYVSFSLTETSDVSIETSGSSGDTIVTLYHDNLTEITTNDNSGTGDFSLIEATLTPGNYYVTINEDGNDDLISDYDLDIDAIELPPPIVDNLEPIIVLISPDEESTRPPATMIILNISDNYEITEVKYNWDSSTNTTIALPPDGILSLEFPAEPGAHILRVYATDFYDNIGFETFIFFTQELSFTSPAGYPFLLIFLPAIGIVATIFKKFKKRELER